MDLVGDLVIFFGTDLAGDLAGNLAGDLPGEVHEDRAADVLRGRLVENSEPGEIFPSDGECREDALPRACCAFLFGLCSTSEF